MALAAAAAAAGIGPRSPKPKDQVLLDIGSNLSSLVSGPAGHSVLKGPILVAIGDASAGKSSLLTALTGLPFHLRSDNGGENPSQHQHVAFLTRVDFVRDPRLSTPICSSSIMPAPNRSMDDKAQFADRWNHIDVGLDGLSTMIDDAAHRIRTVRARNAEVDSSDGLYVTISGAMMPQISIMDVPYLDFIDHAFFANPRVVLMPVVSLDRDLHTQPALSFAQRCDPAGERCLVVCSKPDSPDARPRLDDGWDKASKLGLHIVCNRDMRHFEDCFAHEATEETYFSVSAAKLWADFAPENRAVKALRIRLSDLFNRQVYHAIKTTSAQCQKLVIELEERLALMQRPLAVPDKRRDLTEIATRFSVLITAAAKGDYGSSDFFDDSSALGALDRRLGAAVDSRLSIFVARMRAEGCMRKVVDGGDDDHSSPPRTAADEITRSDYLAEVKNLMVQRQGWELAGMFNPTLVNELFKAQSRPWKDIVENAVADVMRLTRKIALDILKHVDGHHASSNLEQFILDRIAVLERELNTEVQRLLEPRVNGRMLSNVTERVKQLHQARKAKELELLMRKSFGKGCLDPNSPNLSNRKVTYDVLADFATRMEESMCDDMDTMAGSLAIDYSEEYYKVAAERFISQIDDFTFESCLLSKLPHMFTPLMVSELNDSNINLLVPDESVMRIAECRQISNNIKVLRESAQELNTINTARPFDVFHLTDINDLPALQGSYMTRPYLTSESQLDPSSPTPISSTTTLAASGEHRDDDEHIHIGDGAGYDDDGDYNERGRDSVRFSFRITSCADELSPVTAPSDWSDWRSELAGRASWLAEEERMINHTELLLYDDDQDLLSPDGRHSDDEGDYEDYSNGELTTWTHGQEVPPEEPAPFLPVTYDTIYEEDKPLTKTKASSPDDVGDAPEDAPEDAAEDAPNQPGDASATTSADPVRITWDVTAKTWKTPTPTVTAPDNAAAVPVRAQTPAPIPEENLDAGFNQAQAQHPVRSQSESSSQAQVAQAAASFTSEQMRVALELQKGHSKPKYSKTEKKAHNQRLRDERRPRQSPTDKAPPGSQKQQLRPSKTLNYTYTIADPTLAAEGTSGAHGMRPYTENVKNVSTLETRRYEFQHISFLDQYKRFSPEELRLADYSLGQVVAQPLNPLATTTKATTATTAAQQQAEIMPSLPGGNSSEVASSSTKTKPSTSTSIRPRTRTRSNTEPIQVRTLTQKQRERLVGRSMMTASVRDTLEIFSQRGASPYGAAPPTGGEPFPMPKRSQSAKPEQVPAMGDGGEVRPPKRGFSFRRTLAAKRSMTDMW